MPIVHFKIDSIVLVLDSVESVVAEHSLQSLPVWQLDITLTDTCISTAGKTTFRVAAIQSWMSLDALHGEPRII